METAREVLVALVDRYAFGEVAALATAGLVSPETASAVTALCAFGQRVLDLDAEDFGMPEPAGDVPRDLLKRARASRMPQTPREQPRGALETLRPAYALLLEVIDIRWRRHEMAALVAVVHIAGEYLPILAWETVLGHAADPVRLAAAVTGPGSRFGVPFEPGGPRKCDHTRPQQSAAERALRVAGEPPEGWRAYLDRQHSHVAGALGVCVADCRMPCSVVTRLDDGVCDDLAARCRLAEEFVDGALVRLRHAAPVGHGFGVPSAEEVLEAWARTRSSLRRHELGRKALARADQDGFPLAGMPEVFAAIAAAPIAPDTLLTDVAARVATLVA